VVFTASAAAGAKAATRIEESLGKKLGVSARVTVLTAAELSEVVAGNPLAQIDIDPSRLLVAFLNDRSDRAKLEPLLAQEWAPDVLALGPHAAYLACWGGILESNLLKAVGRVLATGVTTRNWATVLKLQALLQA
jgi:uncharacterized protein (DUF1697 family)